MQNFIKLDLQNSKNPYFDTAPNARKYRGEIIEHSKTPRGDPFYQIKLECARGMLIEGKKIENDAEVESVLVRLYGQEKAKNVAQALTQNLFQQIRYPLEMSVRGKAENGITNILQLNFYPANLYLSKSKQLCLQVHADSFGVIEMDQATGLVKNNGAPNYLIPGEVVYSYVYHEVDKSFHLESTLASNLLLKDLFEKESVPNLKKCVLQMKVILDLFKDLDGLNIGSFDPYHHAIELLKLNFKNDLDKNQRNDDALLKLNWALQSQIRQLEQNAAPKNETTIQFKHALQKTLDKVDKMLYSPKLYNIHAYGPYKKQTLCSLRNLYPFHMKVQRSNFIRKVLRLTGLEKFFRTDAEQAIDKTIAILQSNQSYKEKINKFINDPIIEKYNLKFKQKEHIISDLQVKVYITLALDAFKNDEINIRTFYNQLKALQLKAPQSLDIRELIKSMDIIEAEKDIKYLSYYKELNSEKQATMPDDLMTIIDKTRATIQEALQKNSALSVHDNLSNTIMTKLAEYKTTLEKTQGRAQAKINTAFLFRRLYHQEGLQKYRDPIIPASAA